MLRVGLKIAAIAGLVVPALLVILLSPCVASELHLPLSEIAQAADLIFIGTAAESVSRRAETGRAIVTDITFDEVKQISSSRASLQKNSSSITMTIAGGEYNGVRMHVSGAPSFVIGERYLLFILDDGKTYMNPIIGGFQGVFEVISEADREYVRNLSGRPVVDIDQEGYVVSAADPFEEGSSYDTYGNSYQQAPLTIGPSGSAVTSGREELHGGFPMTLDEFINRISHSLRETILDPRIRMDTSGIAIGFSDIEHGIPRVPPQRPSDNGNGELGTSISKGGTIGTCGAVDLPLTMEQVPSGAWSFWINEYCMGVFNQFMDIYEVDDSNGSYGAHNSESEFCGLMDDAAVVAWLGTSWGTTLAICITWVYSNCGEIYEADIAFNPAYTWTNDEDFAVANDDVILLRTALMHELGHSWGMMREPSYPETYDYDYPTVMHDYYHHVVENGRGIHAPDAYLIRSRYADQTSIPSITDVGVESYYAWNGLHNSTTDEHEYCPGASISFVNVTVENMSDSSVTDLRIRFFLSEDTTITTDDYQVGGDAQYWYWTSFPSGVGQSEWAHVDTYTSTIPTGIPEGLYYVGAIVTVNGFNSDDFAENNSTYFYDSVTITMQKPEPPWLIEASQGNDTDTVPVSWIGSDCASYHQVYRATSPGGTKTPLSGWISPSSYDDTSATPGTVYYYWLKAATSSSGANESDYSSSYTGWLKLSPPGSVSATDGADTYKVRITWSSSSGASHYQVYRASSLDGTKTPLSGWITPTSYDDTSATPGTTYYYWVKAKTDGVLNESDYSSYDTGWRQGGAAAFQVSADGTVGTDSSFHAAEFVTGSADVAEWVVVSESIEAGDVVEFDPTAPGQYRIAQDACSSLVAGVISTTPGVTLGTDLDVSEKALLALIGIVPGKVTNEGGPIQPGDLLVTSSTPGHAMRWAGSDPCQCSLVGKALEPMDEEHGVILVLLTAH